MAAVIYEVTLYPAAEVEDEFARWLPAHVDAVIATGCFAGAQIFTEQPTVGELTPCVFCVHYEAASRSQVDRYLSEFAASLRAEGLERFGENFRAARRILVNTQASNH